MSALDHKLTIFLNSLNSPFWDDFFFVFSGQLFWLPLAASIIIVLCLNYGKRAIIPLIFIALIILVADQISSSIFKPLVERLRPSHDPNLADIIHTVRSYRGGKYGFVSSHAANAFAFATFAALILKNKHFSLTIFSWATITAYSRIYLGVHFLGDIVCGAIVGVIIAVVFVKIYNYLSTKNTFSIPQIPQKHINIISITYIVSIITLLLLSNCLIFMA